MDITTTYSTLLIFNWTPFKKQRTKERSTNMITHSMKSRAVLLCECSGVRSPWRRRLSERLLWSGVHMPDGPIHHAREIFDVVIYHCWSTRSVHACIAARIVMQSRRNGQDTATCRQPPDTVAVTQDISQQYLRGQPPTLCDVI